MKKQITTRRTGMMAVMLGTALTALSGSPAQARQEFEPAALRDVSRYCVACWRNAGVPVDRWEDCTQEVLCRLMQRVPLKDWEQMLAGSDAERREFHRVIDLVKKRVRREKRAENLELYPVADRRGMSESNLRELRSEVWTAADRLLTSRQKDILTRSADGSSVAEIATELKLSPQRVSDEKYKAVRKLASHFEG